MSVLLLVLAAAATNPVTVGAVVVDVPKSMATKVVADESGSVDVVVGEAGKDTCMIGVEVYSEAAADRPKDLAALATAVDEDHTAPFEVVERAHKVKLATKDVIRGATKSGKSGRLQRQAAFFVKGNAVVLSFYVLAAGGCAAIEEPMIASARSK